MSEPTAAERRWHRRNDWERTITHMENISVRMPKLIVIPAGAKPHQCGCGSWQYFVRDGEVTRTVSISGKFYSKTAKAEITVPGCKGPTATSPGLGFDHHIDCALREQFRKRPRSKDQQQRDVVAAEALAVKYGVKCSGVPGYPGGECNGDAVVAVLLAKRLFATPCAVHADRVTREIENAGRTRDMSLHSLDEFLKDRGDDVAKKFAERASVIRKWHTERGGLTVPKQGHL